MSEVGVDGLQVGVGEERVMPPYREQRVGVVGVLDAAHDQAGGDLVASGERGVLDLGDLGVGNQFPGVGVGDRTGRVQGIHSLPVNTVDGLGDARVTGHHQRELDAGGDRGADDGLVAERRIAAGHDLARRPQARAVVIAERNWEAAPRPEPALPARSRISAITGAACAVDRAVTCGERPLRSRARPAIFACP